MFSSSKRVDTPYPNDRDTAMTPSFHHSQQATVIAKGVRVEGDFRSQGDVVIEGDVEGAVTLEGMLTVGSEATIKADIHAGEVKISGNIQGNLFIKKQAIFHSSARIAGDIVAERITVESGAIINGRVHIGEGASSSDSAQGNSSQVESIKEESVSAIFETPVKKEEEETKEEEQSSNEKEDSTKEEKDDTKTEDHPDKGQQQLQAIIHTTSSIQ